MRVTPLLLALAVPRALPAPPPADTLIAEVRTLSAAADNDARFDALTALLKAHDLPFTVEPVTLDEPPGSPPSAGYRGVPDPRTRGRNVVVTVGRGRDVVLVGAHYDAKWVAKGTLSRGAIDNGASSVMLVHVASALRGERLDRQVKFVWFDFEESGLLGSAKYLEAHHAEPIVAMLNYDINGYGDTVLYGLPIGGNDPRLARSMAGSCASEGIDCVRFDVMPAGDDRTFGARGIPALSIALLPATEVHQLWLMMQAEGAGLTPGFRPPILGLIHTAGDVPEKLDGAGMAKAERLALALIRRLSTMPGRP